MALPAAAQFNSPQAKGYAARASAMLAEGNFQGCIDQCTMALQISPAGREGLMWMSAVAAYRGGFADAGERLTAFMRAFPASPMQEQARLMSASLTFFNGDYAAALTQLQAVSASSLEPGAAEDLTYRMAYCCMMLGEHDRAVKLFDKLEKTGRYADASLFYRGYAAWTKGDLDQAERLFSQTDRNADPGRLAPYYLAEIAYARGDFKRAAQLAEPLQRLQNVPADLAAESRRLLGESLFALGRENEGVAILREYLAGNRESAPVSTLYAVGTDAYRHGQCEEAAQLLSAPGFGHNAMGQSAALMLGLSYLNLGNTSAAILAFQRAIDMDFDPTVTETAFYNYAVARTEGGRVPFGNSIGTLEEFLKRFPESRHAPTVQEYLVKGYIATDDYAAALRSINALKRPSADVQAARQRVHFVLGTRALQAGNADAAIEQLRAAERLGGPDQDIARQNTLWLGDALYAKGDYQGAEKQYRAFLNRAPKNDPNVATATYNLGYALFGSRSYEAARERLLAATEATALGSAIRADACNRVADTYYYQSDFQNALKYYGMAREMNPPAGDYPMMQQAMMLGLLGRRQEKLDGLDRMVQTYPQSALTPSALIEKALTLASAGQTQKAMEVYSEVTAQYPATAQGRNAMLQLAILSLNAGDRARAIDRYKQVISSYPSSSEAAIAVQDLTRIMGEDDRIDELTAFLATINGAPAIDSVELNALASASLLKKAASAETAGRRTDAIAYSSDLLDRFPDSEAAEEALAIRAKALYEEGRTEEALTDWRTLEERASSAKMHHRARMGVLAAATDLGRHDLIIATARQIKSSAAGSDSDLPRVNYLLACALHDNGQHNEAMELWTSLAKHPENLYGTRAALSMAEALRESGENRRAMDTVNKLIDANPPHAYWMARAFILLSDMLRDEGSEFEADEYLRVLRANYPGNDADIFQMIDQRLK